MENVDLLNYDLQISPSSQAFLRETAKWGKFLSIIGFVMCGLIAVGAFFAPRIYSRLYALNDLPASAAAITSIVVTVIYFLFAILLLIPCLYLNKFATKMQMALNNATQEYFDDSFKNLKSLFKFYGIFTIVILSFYVLVFVFAMLGLAMGT